MYYTKIIMLSLLIFITGCGINEVTEEEIVIEVAKIENDSLVDNKLIDGLNEFEFNSNLKDFEKQWLEYLDNKYPESKLYHIKTENINCEQCYEVSYKKDRTVIKIKVLDGEKTSESISSDLIVDIENKEVCGLFQGEWNSCPKLCNTDEEACITQCGRAICEFDETKIVYKQEGDICGGLNLGDCDFGLTCKYENKNDVSGICINN
jgi:hypothetical protein